MLPKKVKMIPKRSKKLVVFYRGCCILGAYLILTQGIEGGFFNEAEW
jgi:hypothetical protein